ncbi:MAG: TolC family protein, partial [bacterium]|nr:TolC family protein [bacterium]
NHLIDNTLTLEELYKTAENNRKDIKALQNKISAMKNERRAIYTEFAPKPRGFYQNQRQGTANIGLGENNVVGLYVDWNLGTNLGVGTITKAKAKTHEINAQIYDLTNKLRDIKEQLLDSYYNSKLLLKRIDITREQVDYATESVLLSEMRMDAGEGILIDVIQAQSQKTTARIEYLNAIIEYNINQVELLFDEGIIDIDKILKDYKP